MPRYLCIIDGCESPVRSLGWCSMHYERWRRHGDPLATKLIRGDDVARLLSKVDKNGPMPLPGTLAHQRGVTSPCWLWTSRLDDGYGHIKIGGKQSPAHRASYRLHGGVLVRGLTLDHLCRIRHCVNPEHLEQVPPGINTLRGNAISAINARRTHCVNGHPFDDKNTFERPGGRGCRACRQAASERYLARKRAAA